MSIYCISFNLDVPKDQRQYNCPLFDEVAAIWVEAMDVLGSMDQSVVLHGNNREITGISSSNAAYVPLSYPAFFPRGEPGWHYDIPKRGFSYADVLTKSARKKASRAQRNSNDKC
jgi:hypothetical protein